VDFAERDFGDGSLKDRGPLRCIGEIPIQRIFEHPAHRTFGLFIGRQACTNHVRVGARAWATRQKKSETPLAGPIRVCMLIEVDEREWVFIYEDENQRLRVTRVPFKS
jgi:hypothetical protein